MKIRISIIRTYHTILKRVAMGMIARVNKIPKK